MWLRVCVKMRLWFACELLSSAVWCVFCCVAFACGLFKRVCVFVCGLLCDLVWCDVCEVLCVLCFWCLCGLCVIECAMMYGVLLLTVCARVGLK